MRQHYLRFEQPRYIEEPVDQSWKSYYGLAGALGGVVLVALFVAMLLTLL